MLNQYGDQQLQKFSRPPRRQSKKYTLLGAPQIKQQNPSRSYRKIPMAATAPGPFKENFNENSRSTRNIHFDVKQKKTGHQRSRSRSILGKSKAQYDLNSSCYVPKQKQTRSRSRWETTQYPQTNNMNMTVGFESDLPPPQPQLKSKYSNSTKYVKSYSHYKPVPNNGPQIEYSNYKTSNFDPLKQEQFIISKNVQFNQPLQKKQTTSKSSKNLPFYQKLKTFNVPSSHFKSEEEENYLNSTVSFACNDGQAKTPRLNINQSLGGLKYKQLYQNSGSRKNLELHDASNFATVPLQKTTSGFSSSSKQPELDDFIIGQCKGEGRFGKVYMAVHKKSGFLCALKKIKKQSVKYMMDQFVQQVKIQMYLNHPKLVKIYGYFADKEHFYMLVEYMEQGSLYSMMKKNKKFEETEAAEKLNQICQGIKQMHDQNIVHRDLKPENVVLSHGVCKVCDFGWAAICQDRRQTYCGTLDYVCPEIIQGNTYDSSADIWCIGILAYELMCGKAPFYDISRQKTMQKIKSCKIDNFPSHLSRKAVKFIQMILKKDPNARVGIQQLLNSQFLMEHRK